jgi:RNA recognition motif-containing protein
MGGGPGGPRPGGAAGPQSPDRTLYVGNLPYDATVEEVQTLINAVVPDGVVRVHLPMDADGRKRGFGFVTLASAEAAKSAADGMKQADIRGRRLIVNLAHPKGERPARPDGGGGFSAGGGGPFPGSFGGGAGGSPPKKPIEEKRKRTFEDGGGAAPGAGRKKAKERGGANKFNYPVDDDE